MAGSLVALGFLALLGQVALLREAAVTAYGSELAIVLAMGCWLLGGALGAATIGGRARPTPEGAARLFLLAGALIPLALLFSRAARPLLGGVRGGYLPFPLQLAALVGALLPVGVAFGALFRAVARLHAANSGSVARAYALESAGAVLGGAAAALVARAGVPNLVVALLCAAAVGWPGRRALGLRFAVVWTVLVLGLLPLAPALDRRATGWTHPGLLESRDTPYGRVTIEGHAGQVTVFVNDALAFATQGTAAEEFTALAALQAPRLDRVLILGGGATGLTQELLRHGAREIVAVDLDPMLQRMLARRLPAELRAALDDPRVRAVSDDPRRFLERAQGSAWDLIVVGMSEPASGAANRFYTREFFARCAARLAPEGALALRLPAAENIWSPALARRTASVVRALRTAFADVLVLPGAAGIVLAAPCALPRDPEPLVARLTARGAAGKLVTPAYVRWLYTNDRLAGIASLLDATPSAVNSDARPVCYPQTLALWLARFYPAAARLDLTAPRTSREAVCWLGAGLALLALLRLAVHRADRRAAVAVAAAGGAGMVLESLLLLAFQARCGALYGDLGLLLTAFMVGLAGGAWAVDGWPAGRTRAMGPLLLVTLALTSGALALSLHAGAPLDLARTMLWLALAGTLTAGVYAHLARRADDPAWAAGPLYGADLLGGCLGSLAASLVLIPLAGLAGSAFLLVGFTLAAACWA